MAKKRKKRRSTGHQRRYPSNRSRLLETGRYTTYKRYANKRRSLPERVRRGLLEISSRAPFGTRKEIRKIARRISMEIGLRKRAPLGFWASATYNPLREQKLRVCAGRQSRKEVLFSMLKVGKGRSGPGKNKRKFTDDSNVRC